LVNLKEETTSCRLEDNVKMDLKRETGCDDVDCIHVIQDRVQWCALVKTGSIKGGEYLD